MSRYFQLLISEEFVERTIPEDDSVRLLDQLVDELDLHSLACSYSRMGRKSATSPRTLLKIMIYANMEGIYSSSSIEIKRIVHAVKAIEKCRYQRNLLSKGRNR